MSSSISKFGQIAVAIDQAEQSAGDRIGGPNGGEVATIARLERSLAQPVTSFDWEWLAKRLARALENGWRGRPAAQLIELAE